MTQTLSGFGLGMRRPHYAHYVAGEAAVDFVEVISENFMGAGGRPIDTLLRARAHYPVALHGVSLSIGSADGPHGDYLARLKALVERIEPAVVSDHLCWTGVGGFNSHDLLPVPLTEEALDEVDAEVATLINESVSEARVATLSIPEQVLEDVYISY